MSAQTIDELHRALCLEYAELMDRAAEVRTALTVIDRHRPQPEGILTDLGSIASPTPNLVESLVANPPVEALERAGVNIDALSRFDGEVLPGHRWEPEDEADPIDVPAPPPARLTPDQRTVEARHIVAAIRTAGRFVWRDQIERELLRNGRARAADLAPMLKSLVTTGQLARVRYNHVNRCTCYGLPAWVAGGAVDESREPAGMKIEAGTAEITLEEVL